MASKRILVVGSGMVARPCVEYLVRNPCNHVTVGCRTLSSAQNLTLGLPRTTAISLDVSQEQQLELQIQAHDLVVSLVPFTYHAKIAELAIQHKKHVVTSSYCSPSIQALDAAAKEAGVTVLNEVGVDPGVDHLYAIKKIDEVHAQGGKILEFYSYCGGLPAPECSDNPLRFKFSWSPRGALLSQQNSAVFLKDGKVVSIPARDLMSKAIPYYVKDGYDFVAYPNRDSLPFREFYKIPEAHTVIRGSLRYEGNPTFVKALIELGWLDILPKDWIRDGMTWAEIWQKLIRSESTDESAIIARIKEICKFSTEAEADRIISGLRWMDILGPEKATIANGTVLDTLCLRLEKLMAFQPGERDLVMLQHKFVVEWADGKMETFTSTLELLGDPDGYSGMSKSVGITCGIATQLLLDGHAAIQVPGVLCPYSRAICDPIRERVEQEGITMIEKKI